MLQGGSSTGPVSWLSTSCSSFCSSFRLSSSSSLSSSLRLSCFSESGFFFCLCRSSFVPKLPSCLYAFRASLNQLGLHLFHGWEHISGTESWVSLPLRSFWHRMWPTAQRWLAVWEMVLPASLERLTPPRVLLWWSWWWRHWAALGPRASPPLPMRGQGSSAMGLLSWPIPCPDFPCC